MKAVGIKGGKGNADAFFIEDNVAEPTLRPGYVLVSIYAFGLNRMDIMQREDKYPYPLLPESGKILGVEFSGTILEKGPDCSGDFKKGDEIFGLAYGGAYAQRIAVSEKMIMLRPSNLSNEEAAGIPETFFTSIQAVHLVGALQPGQKVLIHAAASGVGQAAVQIAKLGGASQIFATAGTDEKCALVKTLGADFAINYRSADFAEVIKRETDGAGVDLIIDLVGRDYWHRNTASAAKDSRIVLVAAMSGSKIDDFDLRALLNKRIWVMATTLRTRDAAYQGRLRDIFNEKIMPHLKNGEVRTVVDKLYPWTEISDAHKRMEGNVSAGKIICKVDQS